MSTRSNPYSLGGWGLQSQPGSVPSVLGALPTPTLPQPTSGRHLFQFVNPNPNILNSSVVGLYSRPILKIISDNASHGYTTFKDVEGRSVASVEWQTQPAVEIRGRVIKTVVRDWLRVTVDRATGRSVRAMEHRGARFVWVPHNDALHLYPPVANAQPCAVVQKVGHVVNLEMTREALSAELLEPCIVAVTLLLSGRRLE